jgi:hypothetical protein
VKRLYNDYSACNDEGTAKSIRIIMDNAFELIKAEIEKDDVCPRDAESLCHSIINISFAEYILTKAMKRVKQERNNKEN